MTRRIASLLVLCACFASGACAPRHGATQPAQREQIQAFPALELDETVEDAREIALPLGDEDFLVVHHAFGEVVVRAVADAPPRARAVIEVSARHEHHAEGFLRESHLRTQRTEEGLLLRLEQPPGAAVGDFDLDVEATYVSSASLTVDVPPGTRLTIETDRGDVTVTGPLGATHIVTGTGHIRMRRVRGGAIATTEVGDIKLRQMSDGPIRAETGRGMVGVLGTQADSIRLRAGRGRIVVNDARSASLEVRTGTGDVRLTEIEGEIDAETSFGALSLTAATGKRIRLRNDGGPLELHDVNALELTAYAVRGLLTAERVEADTIDLGTETGEMVLTDLTGNLVARTSVGHLDAERLEGARLELSSGLDGVSLVGATGRVEAFSQRGLIAVSEVTGGLHARTTTGAIRADGIFDDVQLASGAGRVRVIAREGSRVIEPWSVVADEGDVILSLPEVFAFTLEAITGGGEIDSEFPILIEAGVVSQAGRFRGTVGGGGGKILLEARRGGLALYRGAD